MKSVTQLFARLLDGNPQGFSGQFFCGKRYIHFKNTFYLIMAIISMVPMTIMAGLGYFQYRQLLNTEKFDQLVAS